MGNPVLLLMRFRVLFGNAAGEKIVCAQTIFSPAAFPNKTLKRISKSTGLPIAKTPLYGEGIAEGLNAVSTATLNVCTIVNGQGGSCDISGAKELNAEWSSIR